MNTLTVDCRQLNGHIRVPYSKSILHRYLICSYLEGEYEIIENLEQIAGPLSDDVKATRDCLAALIKRDPKSDISPDSSRDELILNCYESGTTLRFMMALAAAHGIECTLLAEGSLIGRPMQPFIDELNRHGASISVEGARFGIKGRLEPGDYELPGNISSQFISGLMLATYDLDGDFWIMTDDEVQSLPYIRMTEKIINAFSSGARMELLEGDWSAGAMWVTANDILGGSLAIDGLSADSLQGDKVIIHILNEYAVEELMAEGSEAQGELTFNVENCPDIVPAIALRAAVSNLKTVITNAGRLKIKESDRLDAIVEIMTDLGADIETGSDGESLIINGSGSAGHSGTLTAPEHPIDTRGDHRMVMLAALASIISEGPIRISGAESVSKSYPGFFDDIRTLGGIITQE